MWFSQCKNRFELIESFKSAREGEKLEVTSKYGSFFANPAPSFEKKNIKSSRINLMNKESLQLILQKQLQHWWFHKNSNLT
jgi:hypothetical protein